MGCEVEVEVIMLTPMGMLFLDVVCSALEDEKEELALSCFREEKEQDTVFFEACKSGALAFPEGQIQRDRRQREGAGFHILYVQAALTK